MKTSIKIALKNHREFFNSRLPSDVDFRIDMLQKLKSAIIRNEKNIEDTLAADLGKSPFESYATEIGIILEEISLHLKKLKKWSRGTRVSTPLVHFPARSYTKPEPYGTVLIMSPWNYPFQLLMAPLIGAISAGNCAVLKPAHYSEKTSALIADIIADTFDERYISVFTGGRKVNQALLAEKYDYIFFTGGEYLGKIVMQAAAEHLTPLTLELGGKSPCIVDEHTNLTIAARRIVWGKYLNSGQTCVAPDYLLVHSSVKNELFACMQQSVADFFGNDPKTSPDYPRIINRKQFKRLVSFLEDGDIVFGGNHAVSERYIAPTLLDSVSPDAPVMSEEIFGPILPTFEWDTTDAMISFIQKRPKPLALYLFTDNHDLRDLIFSQLSFGGGCVNDTIVHVANQYLPFGGVGASGMGNYHGKASFDTFSNYRGILEKSTRLDIPVRYPPYKGKMKLLKMFLK